MADRLEIVNQRIDESEMKMISIASLIGIARTTLYNWLANANITKEQVAQIGYAINHDFSADFPDMKGYRFNVGDQQLTVGEPEVAYKKAPDTITAQLERQEKMLNRILSLLEKNNNQ